MGKAVTVTAGSQARPMTAEGILYLALLAIQFGMQPLLYKEFMAKDVDKGSIVLACEVIKFVLASTMLVTSGSAAKAFENWTVRESLQTSGLPAVVYSIQNLFIQLAVSNMDGLSFNLLNQSKIICTAIALYFLMGRKQSAVQCLALVGLFSASAILSMGKSSAKAMPAEGSDDMGNSFALGIVPCIVASVLSGLASALSQVALQAHNRNSFLFTMELSLFSMVSVLLVQTGMGLLNGSADTTNVITVLQFDGWTLMSLIPVLSNGLGGICVGLVMKHAGGVRKGFSIVTGIILTGVAQYLLYQIPLSSDMLLALPIVIISTLLHIAFPYVDQSADVAKKSQ